MGKSRSKGASKGKRYTRRRVKGGNNTPKLNSNDGVVGLLIPKSVKKSGTYGFGQNRLINPNPKTIWSKETGFGFTPPVVDINVDEYNDATLFDDNVSLFNSASANKNSGKKLSSLPKTSLPKTSLPKTSLPKTSLPKTSLPKTSLPTDIDLKYSKIMKSFIALGNKMLEDTKGELTRTENAARASDNKKLHEELNAIKVIVDQWDIQNTQFIERALNFLQIDSGKPLKIESDYLDALAFIVKNSFDYFSKVKIAVNPFMKKYKDKFKNDPKNPWWKFNFTKKNKNKGKTTGTQAIHKIQQIATGANITQAGEILKEMAKLNEPITNDDAIKKVWARLKQEQEV